MRDGFRSGNARFQRRDHGEDKQRQDGFIFQIEGCKAVCFAIGTGRMGSVHIIDGCGSRVLSGLLGTGKPPVQEPLGRRVSNGQDWRNPAGVGRGCVKTAKQFMLSE